VIREDRSQHLGVGVTWQQPPQQRHLLLPVTFAGRGRTAMTNHKPRIAD
jgi:hypothetical protein